MASVDPALFPPLKTAIVSNVPHFPGWDCGRLVPPGQGDPPGDPRQEEGPPLHLAAPPGVGGQDVLQRDREPSAALHLPRGNYRSLY